MEVGVEAPGAVLAVHAHTAGAARLPPPGVDEELRDLGLVLQKVPSEGS